MAIIELRELEYQYEESDEKVLKGLTKDVHRGEWLSIIGANGSGKSTLSRLFNGLSQPTEGSVHVLGKNTADDKALQMIRQEVGMVFQNPEHQFVAPTVRDDIAFGMENAGVPREVMLERIKEVSQWVNIEHILHMEPHRLSGGQKQRAAIAGILALRPQVMVFDESTSMLDPNGRKEILETMSRLCRESGITIISITHYLEEAFKSDRIWFMKAGRIEKDITTKNIPDQLEWMEAEGMPLPYKYQLYQEVKKRRIDMRTLRTMVEGE
ncbi:energy-coupling factor transporter ATPase [Marinococcus halophilus]|uniref:Energy-coupling factor transporter ATP-binding protein EcfA1 n=1 Tax=Marinococcus halophilus TaxID=1371 RepID=A0A510Y8P6_MARHA|nr:energy-coupling factor transporter ATPase [Marinococcus halophilus]OZT79263.1 energy-coupling factor transporter ATPase [Marinococcus halophilus]GEK59750.1 energy-coupling factor transporter ATP-binding protein EcfA1 [Marinococcus halophilus]